MKKQLLLGIGLLTLILSLYQAFILKYNHFYEFMLVGLFLILYPFISKKKINDKIYLYLYISFIFGGLIGDLFIGITIANLWYYTYNSLIEYVFLYLLVYPLGGIVMVQSYLFLKEKFKLKNRNVKYNLKLLKIIIISLFLILLLIIVIDFFLELPEYKVLYLAIPTLIIIGYDSYKSEKMNKISYINDFLSNFKVAFIITILATYLNAFIDEYSNTFAKQWIYASWTFNYSSILNIPFIVLGGWLILLIITISSYYLLVSLLYNGN